MAEDKIIVEYEARTSQLNKALDKVEKDLRDVEKASKGAWGTLSKETKKAGIDLDKTEAKVKKTGDTLKKESKSVGLLSNTFSNLGKQLAVIVSVGAAIALGKQIVDVTGKFEKLKAVLANTLGSSNLAEAAFASISKIAATTNFSVLELTDAYVKLTNQGFQPTERELIKLADIANSTGKSYDQLAEAIIDAGSLQFERLKEFGIKAEQSGDKVKFTFKGVSTEVSKSSSAIQAYVLGLGELNGVQGSTAAISETVEGKISNLGDAMDSLFYTIGSAGSGVFKDFVSGLSSFIGWVSRAIQTTEQFQQTLTLAASDKVFNNLMSRQISDLQKFEAQVGNNKEAVTDYIKSQISTFEEAKAENEVYVDALKKKQTELNDFIIKSRKTARYGEQYKEAVKDLELVGSEITILSGTIIAQERVVADFNKKLTANARLQAEADAAAIKASEELAKLREKQFKDALDLLGKQEKLAIEKAKVADKSEADIFRIEQEYNDKRESIYVNFGKQRTIDYKFLVLREEELEKELTQFYSKEQEERKAIREALTAQQLSDMDASSEKQKLSTSNFTDFLVKKQRESYAQGKISAEEYEKSISDITYEGTRDQLIIGIEADKKKLEVSKLTAEQRVSIQSDLSEKLRALDDEDFNHFKAKEEEKIKKAKETSDKLKEIALAGFDIATDLANGLYDNYEKRRQMDIAEEQDKLKNETESRIAALDTQLASGLISQETYNGKKIALDQKQKSEEAKLKKKAFDADKKAQLASVVINTAAAVIKTLAQLGFPAGLAASAVVIAQGAVQGAIISSQPTPKFKDGVIGLKGKGTSTSDSIHAMLSKGESVMTARETAFHRPILESIRNNSLEDHISKSYVLPAMKQFDIANIRNREERANRKERKLDTILNSLNFDTSSLERATKGNKNVNLNNSSQLAKAISREISLNGNWFKN